MASKKPKLTTVKPPAEWDDALVNAAGHFRDEVCARSAEIDPEVNLDWYSLSIGYLIGCGLSPDDADTVALWLRYQAHYFIKQTVVPATVTNG